MIRICHIGNHFQLFSLKINLLSVLWQIKKTMNFDQTILIFLTKKSILKQTHLSERMGMI